MEKRKRKRRSKSECEENRDDWEMATEEESILREENQTARSVTINLYCSRGTDINYLRPANSAKSLKGFLM